MFDSWLKTSLTALVLFLSAAVLADGFVIYSSWQLEWRARTEAVRTTKSLGVEATVKPARVSGKDWYRVVAPVDSQSGERLMLDAMDRDWDVWYLSASDSTWVSNGATSAQPLAADTLAPASLVAKPLFSEDNDDAAKTLAPSALPIRETQEQADPETEATATAPEETSPAELDEKEIAMEPVETGPAELDEEELATESDETTPVEPSGEELAVESDDELVASADVASNGGGTMTVESTLREVEEIQKQAQGLISNWVQREDPTTYEFPTESDTEMREAKNLGPSRETWFNELRVPQIRRR